MRPLVSRDGAGQQGNGNSFRPTLTPDGRYLAFESAADNLTAGHTGNTVMDIFVIRGPVP